MCEWRLEVKYNSVVTQKGGCLHWWKEKMAAHLATVVRDETPL